ncbi:metallophosphoesterase [Ferdinandcohnia quinoae]|uniref:Metallophosphoesterase n=1 Tax=Fredinandcohnia quinoae TaxID=2918902 RepID=A0AAW5E5W3_9BACI|nr:metallophosphoesterase [Fredinandcohnia sp. SECRCQ15]MCH1624776.1 metallophosphoesterase [Fredinandcohnia sp. SECRCQ15]
MILFFIFIFILLFLIGCSLLYYMWRMANQNNVCKHTLSFDTFPKSFEEVSIFFISDIHRRKISEKIVQEVKGKTDIVVIGGDLTEKGVPFERVKDNLLQLKKIAPTYFVWGNNDYEVDYHMLDSLMLEHGIKILDNTAALFESAEGEKFALLGIDDLKYGRSNLNVALSDSSEQNIFRILICHNPAIKRIIQPEHQISFILSGHTHGGQIRLFNLGMYKKGGIEKFGQTTMLISNGYGTSRLPLRLGVQPETHLITIRPSQNDILHH